MNCKILSFYLLFIVPFQLLAQPVIVRQRSYGATDGCNFIDMKLTYDKGLVMGASSSSQKGIDKSEDSDNGDFWIVKVDSLGNKQWDKTITRPYWQNLTCLSPTRDHGYIIGGEDFLPDQPSNYWVVKLDSAGNIQWNKLIVGNADDALRSLDTTSDGGYILGGWSTSARAGDKTENNKGFTDYWIVKLDSEGNIQWDKTIGGDGFDELEVVKQTRDGGYIVGGGSNSNISGDKSESWKGGDRDYWVAKLDSIGNKQWDKDLGGADQDYLTDIIQTFDDSYVAAGFSSSGRTGNKTQPSKGNSDYWLVLLDSSGHIQYDLALGGNNGDIPTSIQQTKDSGLIAVGTSYSGISGDKTEPLADAPSSIAGDYWIVKLDKKGRLQWDKDLGGSQVDQGYAICEYKRDTYIVGGVSQSRISGNRTRHLKGYTDMWIVMLRYQKPLLAVSTITSVVGSKSERAVNKFIIYPNPAKYSIHIQSSGKATYILTDQSGKTVLSKTINGNGQINVFHLPTGIYYLQNIATGMRQKVLIL